MKRALSNFAILLVLTVAISAMLATMTGPSRTERDHSDEAAAAEATDDATSTAGAATTAADDAVTDTAIDTAATPTTPDHLDPGAAADTATQVAGVAIAQTAETLPVTGADDPLVWIVLAVGGVAAGTALTAAARDHAKGELTLV